MELVALLVSVLALVVAVLGYATTRKAQADSSRSADAALRSAAAAEDANRLAVEQATRYVPPWAITWVKGVTYHLTNTGDEIAVDVRLEPAHGSLELLNNRQWGDIGPRESRDFGASVRMNTIDRSVVVTWRRPGERQDRDWRHPLPAQAK